jgi:hypothetical protein
MSPFILWAALLGLAAVVAGYLRSHRKLADQQQATLGEVLEELTSLRSALVASGAIERPARLPPDPPLPEPSPPPAPRSTGRVQAPDEPPSTKPVRSRTLASAVSPIGDRPAALPRQNADDDSEEGRDTSEDMTRVFSKEPGAADAQIPGVEVKPLPPTVRPPPHRPPRPIADPLAGALLERPTSSATRTAEAFRGRATLRRGPIAAPGDEQDPGGEP